MPRVVKKSKGFRIVSVRARNPFLAVSEFFGKRDFGKRIRPFAVKGTRVKRRRIKGLYDVKLLFEK